MDYSGGLVAAIALLAGVHAARRDGVGMDCDVILFDTAFAMLTYPAIWSLNGNFEPVRTHHSAHPSLVPFQAFRARDGWIVVACPKQKFWNRLTGALGIPELAGAQFTTFADRRRNADELCAILDEVIATRFAGEWLQLLGEAGVPCGPVNSVAQALADEQTLARGMVIETEHPGFGTILQLRSPVQVGNDQPQYRRAPARHEDADAVLTDLFGYRADTIVSLVSAGAFGRREP